MKRFRRAYYDLFSHVYDRVIALHSGDTGARARDFLVEHTGVAPGARVLDLCTGTGAVALRASRATGPEGLAVGLDFSSGMICKARGKADDGGFDGVAFLVGDAARLPFASGTFDAVSCSHAMYELSPEVRDRTLAEARRVLRPGGQFLMMEHCEPTRPFIRLLYRIRLSAMGSSRNREFARDEVPFLARFFSGVQSELSPTARSKLVRGVKEEPAVAPSAASSPPRAER
jgi:demethylmenaquinone methyltransferase/2-methoxy-6-polyprenyl-1,4-benzoquinol methylase